MKKTGIKASTATRGGLLAVGLLIATFGATSAAAVALQPTSSSPVSASQVASLPLAQADQIAEGEVLFDSTCSSCHQTGGIGVEGTYPPLLANPHASDPAYVEDVVRHGKKGQIEVAGVIYDSTMSSKGEDLSDAEISAVVAYVVDLAGQSADTAAPDVAALPEGVASRGNKLFRGDVKLANGASACASCHFAGSVSNLGGTSLGPDLTYVAEKLGGVQGLSGWLTNPPAPTMTPIFSRHPLTANEIADLSAFLDDTPYQKRRTYFADTLFFGGVIGALILFGGMAIAWRGMRQTYVEKLRSRR